GIDPHPAAHLAHETLRDEETEAGALPAAGLVELREDPLALRLRDADALVRDVGDETMTVAGRHRARHDLADDRCDVGRLEADSQVAGVESRDVQQRV